MPAMAATVTWASSLVVPNLRTNNVVSGAPKSLRYMFFATPLSRCRYRVCSVQHRSIIIHIMHKEERVVVCAPGFGSEYTCPARSLRVVLLGSVECTIDSTVWQT
jgi:hypothetical protein